MKLICSGYEGVKDMMVCSGLFEWICRELSCCMQFESLIDGRLSGCVLAVNRWLNGMCFRIFGDGEEE